MATSVKKNAPAALGGNMTLTGHLKELRNRIFICVGVFFVCTVIALSYSSTLIDAFTQLGLNCTPPYTFVTISPQEKLLQYFKLSLVAAAVVTIPVAMFQVWAFAKPGLKKGESSFFGLALVFGLFLFCVGVVFAYKVTLPFMLNFLISLSGTDYITANISLAEYMNFVTTIFLIFGSVFEIPLLTVILSRMGIANPKIMRQIRGVAIVLIFVIAAIITPPDIVSQVMVALPMILLYEISIVLSGIFYKKHVEAEAEAEDDDEDDED